MNRLNAILRCLFYGLLPWPVELIWRGYVHYTRRELGYAPSRWLFVSKKNLFHAVDNLREAWKLITFQALSQEDLEFHKL